MKREKELLQQFMAVAPVLILQNIITLGVNLTDNMMLGIYAESALSGAAVVNQIQFFYQQILLGLGDALVIFGSQYLGNSQILPIKKVSAAALRVAVTLSIILFLVVSLFPYEILRLFTTSKPILQEGMDYIRIIRFTYLPFAVTQILLAMLRSVKIVKLAFHLSVVTFLLNCVGNYVFIYGHLGIQAMGISGAAISTLIARLVECGIVLFYILKRDQVLKTKFLQLVKTDRKLAKDYFKIAFPMAVVQGMWGISTGLQTVVLGHMSDGAIAANSVASTIFSFVKSMPTGAASASAVIIGYSVGTGKFERTKRNAETLQKIFLLIGIVAGILLFIIRIPILEFYDLSESTRTMANQFLILLSGICIPMTYQVASNWGIIRGGGEVSFGVKMDFISSWLIVLPLSVVMAFVIKASPVTVVLCLNSDQIFKCIPVFLKVRFGKWIKPVVENKAEKAMMKY